MTISAGLAALVAVSCSGNRTPDAYGIIDAESWMIAASSQGQIVSLDVSEGDRVSKGQVVGLVDTVQFSIQLKATEAQITSLRQNLRGVRNQMDQLRKQKESVQTEMEKSRPVISSSPKLDEALRVFDNQESAARSSLSHESSSVQASIAALEAQADMLRESIARCSIVNPENGTVSGVFVRNHEFVSAGMPVYRLSDYDNMFVDCWFDTESLGSVKLGDTVDILPDFAGKHKLGGEVVYISEESEFAPNKVMTRDSRERFVYRVRVSVRNDGSLKAGMPAEIYLRSAK